jgi:hypothetical protein
MLALEQGGCASGSMPMVVARRLCVPALLTFTVISLTRAMPQAPADSLSELGVQRHKNWAY